MADNYVKARVPIRRDLYALVRVWARQEGMTVSQWLTIALNNMIDSMEPDND